MASSFIAYLNTFIHSFSVLEDWSSVMEKQVPILKKEIFFPENYFYVTHLSNPSNAFWTKKHPVPNPSDISRKLLLGKRLERFAAIAFRNLDGFMVEGAKLDGFSVGLKGVRGEIDFKIGDSLVEFKTKDFLPNDIFNLYESYPQDVEQLLFYAAIHPSRPLTNYLVFMNNVHPYKIKAFKIIIKNIELVVTLIKIRMASLSKAIEDDNPSDLGQCRYLGVGCKFDRAGICTCRSLSKPDIPWKKYVDITEDKDFTDKLQLEIDKIGAFQETLSTKDLIAPRLYFMERKLGRTTEWVPSPERDGYLVCVDNLLHSVKEWNLTSSQYSEVKSRLKEPRVHTSLKWINFHTSIKPAGELLPYIVKISDVDEMKYAARPSQYAVAEMAIICAINDIPKGLIFTVYPQLGDLIRVYEINFKNFVKLKDIIKERIDTIFEVVNHGSLMDLEACPNFFNTNNKCPLDSVCNKNKSNGCLN